MGEWDITQEEKNDWIKENPVPIRKKEEPFKEEKQKEISFAPVVEPK